MMSLYKGQYNKTYNSKHPDTNLQLQVLLRTLNVQTVRAKRPTNPCTIKTKQQDKNSTACLSSRLKKWHCNYYSSTTFSERFAPHR